MTEEIRKFEVGKIYKMESDSDGMEYSVRFKVIKRTEKFVTLRRLGFKAEDKRMMVKVYNGRENVNPYGFALIFA